MQLRRAVTPLIVGLLVGVGQEAMADDWGCQVLLCLSDARGATTESECRPPIEKLWKQLRRGKPFPTCVMAGNPATGTGSYAKQGFDYFDPCPPGTRAVTGYVAVVPAPGRKPVEQHARSGAIAEGDYAPEPIACAGNAVGSYVVGGGGDSGEGKRVTMYDRIEWQQPKGPNVIDVYIDGQMYKRVRY